MLSKERIKQLKALQLPKFRKESKLFVAEGPKLLGELLESPFKVVSVYHTVEWRRPLNADQTINFTEITNDELKKISSLVTPNQVIAVVRMSITALDWKLVRSDLTLLLDSIQDPGNLGTIIRIADWFGVKQIICSPDCVDVYNPKVVQSSMGSVFRVKVFYKDLQFLINDVKDEVPVYGALLDGENVLQVSLEPNAFLVIGSESHGISKELEPLITKRISIPAFNAGGTTRAESLNASVATGILLHEFRRKGYCKAHHC